MTDSASSSLPHCRPHDDVVADFGTNVRDGLSSAEAQRRLANEGRNELTTEAPIPGWRKFLAQFQDVLVGLLLIATLISAVLWYIEGVDPMPYEAIAIFAVVLLNAVMGYVQQSRAEHAVAALRKMSAAHANIIRDGTRQSIPAVEVVPGDILLIEEGDTVAADARLVHAVALQAAEASLTGESLPVNKQVAALDADTLLGDRTNMIFSGTSITHGHGRAVVTATGMRTEMGRIAGMLKAAPAQTTPLQEELARVGKLLGLIVVAIAVVMIVTIVLVGNITSVTALFDVLILGVALAVAAVPEGLPAVVTAVLALGVQRMAKRNAIVRHLAAVETLGAANEIASDKTGTLTKNEMTVRTLITASGAIRFEGTGYAPEGTVRREDGGEIDDTLRGELWRALAAADRANNAILQESGDRWIVQGDPTEGALVVATRKAGLTDEILSSRFERIGEIPFSSERKLMSTVHSDAKRRSSLLTFTKGAPDVLIARCTQEQVGEERRPLTPERRSDLMQINEQLARQALRTLALAMKILPSDTFDRDHLDEEIEHDLILLGLVGMIDPPRPEAASAVARAQAAGIRPIMITGDHPMTAEVIARELGVTRDGRVATGAEIEKVSDDDLADLVKHTSVYARVNPSHKLRIVKALQANGSVVAMTGDGVNDAPALKTADIGIAMGITGTDVSKEAADIVLADDNFASIVAAVEEGRAIFANIRKFLRYLLASNIGEVLTMFFGLLLADAIGLVSTGETIVLPLLATHILWINLVTDGAPALALGVDPPDGRVMLHKPRPRSEGVITSRMWQGIAFTGVIMAIGTLYVIDASLPGGLIEGTGDLMYAQTMAFNTLVMFSLFAVFNSRSDEQSAFVGLFSNRWLWAAVILSLAMQMAVLYVPFLQRAFSTVALSAGDWLMCAAVGSSVLWLREVWKFGARRKVIG